MKLHFDANQDYQLQAIEAIVDAFEGRPLNQSKIEYSLNSSQSSLCQSEYGIGKGCISWNRSC